MPPYEDASAEELLGLYGTGLTLEAFPAFVPGNAGSVTKQVSEKISKFWEKIKVYVDRLNDDLKRKEAKIVELTKPRSELCIMLEASVRAERDKGVTALALAKFEYIRTEVFDILKELQSLQGINEKYAAAVPAATTDATTETTVPTTDATTETATVAATDAATETATAAPGLITPDHGTLITGVRQRLQLFLDGSKDVEGPELRSQEGGGLIKQIEDTVLAMSAYHDKISAEAPIVKRNMEQLKDLAKMVKEILIMDTGSAEAVAEASGEAQPPTPHVKPTACSQDDTQNTQWPDGVPMDSLYDPTFISTSQESAKGLEEGPSADTSTTVSVPTSQEEVVKVSETEGMKADTQEGDSLKPGSPILGQPSAPLPPPLEEPLRLDIDAPEEGEQKKEKEQKEEEEEVVVVVEKEEEEEVKKKPETEGEMAEDANPTPEDRTITKKPKRTASDPTSTTKATKRARKDGSASS